MTEFADLNQVNMLHQEALIIAQAINNLDADGYVSAMSCAPAPYVYNPEAPTPPSLMMTVNVTLSPPTNPVLLVEIRKALVDREVEIATELAALGVTATPPAHTR